MSFVSPPRLPGRLLILVAAVLWGTTGTAATFAPDVSPIAIGAAAMGFGGLLQALIAVRSLRRHAAGLRRQWRIVALGAVAVALYPLAFYSSMQGRHQPGPRPRQANSTTRWFGASAGEIRDGQRAGRFRIR